MRQSTILKAIGAGVITLIGAQIGQTPARPVPERQITIVDASPKRQTLEDAIADSSTMQEMPYHTHVQSALEYWTAQEEYASLAGKEAYLEKLTYAIMAQESKFDRTVVSSRGAIGLMQVVHPEQNKALFGERYPKLDPQERQKLKANHKELFDPECNIRDGVQIILDGVKYAQNKLSLHSTQADHIRLIGAYYNAGITQVNKAYNTMDANEPTWKLLEHLPDETRNFASTIYSNYGKLATLK